MKEKREHGFSLVELLVVVVVIGIVSSISITHLQKAIRGAEVGSAFATLRTVASTEMSYFQQNGRFARITEVNNVMSGAIGTPSGNEVSRNKFIFAMVPPTPTDFELRDSFTMTATRNVVTEGTIYVFELTQSGQVRQVLP